MMKVILGVVSAAALASSANATVAVSIWTDQPAAASDATIAAAGGLGAANGTATVDAVDLYVPESTTGSISAFLNGATVSDPATGAHAANDSYFLLTGGIYLNAGANLLSILHDDGVQLAIDGYGLVIDAADPTSPTTDSATLNVATAGVYGFQLAYGECCGGPAVLQFAVNDQTVTGVPEPTTWATMLLGFGAIGFAARRSRKQRSAAQLA